jgi:phosphoribosylglycinamide formyltransferase-1
MKPSAKPRVVVLISGGGTNLQAILDQVHAGQLAIDIVAVVSDKPDAFGLQRAASANVPVIKVDFDAFDNRDEFDAALELQLTHLQPDLIVLAGYMRILAQRTVNLFLGRMLNIHPSLLPAYPGLHTYRRALDAGEQWHGTTVHFVIPELDAGPAILQYRVAIDPNETEPELKARVQLGEYLIYPQAIDLFARGKIELRDGAVLLDNLPLAEPIVTDEISTKANQ